MSLPIHGQDCIDMSTCYRWNSVHIAISLHLQPTTISPAFHRFTPTMADQAKSHEAKLATAQSIYESDFLMGQYLSLHFGPMKSAFRELAGETGRRNFRKSIADCVLLFTPFREFRCILRFLFYFFHRARLLCLQARHGTPS